MRAAALVAALALLTAGCGQIEGLRGPQVPPGVARGEQLLQQAIQQHKPVTDAVKEFDKAIAADPNNIDVYLAVMSVCLKAGQAQLVTQYGEIANRATSKAPADQRSFMLRMTGGSYLQLDKPEKAVEFNEAALKLRPNDPGCMNDLGYSYAVMYESHANDPGAVSKLMEALRLTQTAVDLAKKQDEEDANIGMLVDSLGWVYFALERYDEAVVTLARAVDLAPDSKEIHVHYARALYAKGRKDAAVLELLKAQRIDPNYPAANDLLKQWAPNAAPATTGQP